MKVYFMHCGGLVFFFWVKGKKGGGGISNGMNNVKFHNVINNCFGVHIKRFPVNFHLKNFKIN